MPEAQDTTALERSWTFPAGPLGELTAAAELRARSLKSVAATLEREAASSPEPVSFVAALRRGPVAVIAELKRRSPSKGVINETLDVRVRAAEYAAAGAAALSVLTEPDRFGGSLDDLRAARSAVGVPLLRKDFIVHPLQVLEARAAGASAVLLIARALPPDLRSALAAAAQEAGLDVLLEVRSERELEHALGVAHAVIGVNNRNLETLVIDDAVSARLLPLIPAHRIAVYESGVRQRADVARAAALGADAVLVGSTLSSSADGGAAAAELVGVARRARG